MRDINRIVKAEGGLGMKLYSNKEVWYAALLEFLALRGFTWTMALAVICGIAFLIGVHK